jgi:oligoendopeptidase F
MTKRLVILLAVLSFVMLSTVALAYDPDPATPRSEIPVDYQWKSEHVFPDVASWKTEYEALSAEIPALANFEGKLGESADNLYECFEKIGETTQRMYRLYIYTSTRLDVELSNSDNMGMQGKIGFMFSTFSSTVSYVTPELLEIPEETIDQFINSHDGLKIYEYSIRETMRQKEHSLSAAEERILSMASQVRGLPGEVSAKLRDVDMKFPDVLQEDGSMAPLTLSGFSKLRASTNPEVRAQAAKAFFETFRDFENTLSATLDGVAKSHLLTVKARNYDNCLQAALEPDHISTDTFRMLIDTVNQNLERTLHKYVALRKKVLGLEGPVTFDNLYNPMLEGTPDEYSYDECRNLLAEGLAPLGDDYVELISHAADPANGWIDIYPNANKRTGAYSNGVVAKDIHPFVLHNYDNSLDAVFTTAHEFGHALHSYYSSQEQPFVYSDYTTFLAEIASTCNEEILLVHMLENEKDPVRRLSLLNKRLENIRLTIFRQTLFEEFELRFHEYAEKDNTLTPDFLNGLYEELITKYYGPDYEMGENDCVEWAFIPHFYYNFYMFTYATGLTSGISLANNIEKDGQKAADQYINNMLKAGCSRPPVEILQSAGVDLTTPKPFTVMLDLFEDTVDEFDKLWTKTYGNK